MAASITMGKEDPESKAQISEEEYAATYSEKAPVSDFKAGAIEAENAEHAQGVLDAVKAYPMAAFWAFVMWVAPKVCDVAILR